MATSPTPEPISRTRCPRATPAFRNKRSVKRVEDPRLPNKPLVFVARAAEYIRFTTRGNRHVEGSSVALTLAPSKSIGGSSVRQSRSNGAGNRYPSPFDWGILHIGRELLNQTSRSGDFVSASRQVPSDQFRLLEAYLPRGLSSTIRLQASMRISPGNWRTRIRQGKGLSHWERLAEGASMRLPTQANDLVAPWSP
jgi:hypothetical protein